MKIKNLLCTAAVAGMLFTTANEVQAAKYNVAGGTTQYYISDYISGQNNYEYISNLGTINNINLNYYNNITTNDTSVISNNNQLGIGSSPAYQGYIGSITGNIENNTIYTLISTGMSTTINSIDLTVKNNNINNILITAGLGKINTIRGTYTNNNGGMIVAAGFGEIGNIYGTFKDNNSGIYLGMIGTTNVFDATIENNHQTMSSYSFAPGAITNFIGAIGQLSGSIKNNSNTGKYGAALFNTSLATGLGHVGITTKNGKDTVFEGNTSVNGENEGIYNTVGTLAFNTDGNAKIIINDKITGDLEHLKQLNTEDIGISADPEALEKMTIADNVILINPSKGEDFIFPEGAELDASAFINYFNLSKNTGVVEFNNTVKDQSIHIYNGTLKLGSWTDSKGVKHYGDFDNVNLNLVDGTLNTIDKEIRNINVVNLTSTNGKLSVDLDLSNNTADTLTAELVNGTFDFNNINFIGTPVNQNGTVQIIAGNIGDQGVTFKDFTTFDSNFDTYTFTDAGNGYVNYQYSKGDGNVTLKMVVDYANGDRSFNMKNNELMAEDLGTMAGEGSTLTVNGNNHTIDGNGFGGLTVNAGQTLSMNNVNVKNFGSKDPEVPASFLTNIGHVENLSGSFTENTNEGYGVIANAGTMNTIDGVFQNNTGYITGAITNIGEMEGTKINKITGSFDNNSGHGEEIGAGAIVNAGGTIDEINASFTNNYTTTGGGAITNFAFDDDVVSTINKISGTFENNKSEGMELTAGAILNFDSTINEISATFKNNSSNLYGGAITNMSSDNLATIYGVEGTFENNSALAGGAIFNMGGLVNIIAKNTDTVFTGNKHITGSNALISVEGMVNLNADTNKSIIFNDAIGFDFNDYVAVMGVMGEDTSNIPEGAEQDFYSDMSADENMININAMKGDYNTYKALAMLQGISEEEINNATEEEMAEFIKMADEEMLNIMNLPNYNSGTVQFNNTVKNSMVSLMNGTLKFGTNTQDGVEYVGGLDQHSILNIFGGTVSLQNGGINNANLGNVQLFNEMKLELDADLANEKIDTISANSFNTNDKQINITNINLLSPTTKETLSLSPLSNDIDEATRQTMAESIVYTGGETAYSPIYKYNVEYDPTTAKLNFGLKPYSAPAIENFNPAVITKPVAQQGAQSVQMDSYTEAFRNMDMFMLMPENERLAYKYRNKYASLDADLVYDPTMSTYQNNTAWFRPYTTFENVPLKNGPKVSNVSYGSYFGYDSSLHELGKGWDGTLGVYAGYNGSHQSFQGNSVYQNGGTLGVIGVAYKGNFFSGWTLNVGASSGSTSNMYGTDNFNSLMGGISTKNGYNFEFADGKVILQPSLLMSYALVNTFDYTNAAGVRLKSDPLHTLQIEPSIKLIGNLGTWQPYANVAMVWNVLNETKVTANNVELPEVSVKPYVKYGVGLQKKWADKFTAFGQAYVTHGGRNGVGLQAGLRIAIGDETVKSKAAWLNPRKMDTVIVLDGKVK